MTWTPDKIKQLKKLWQKGKSTVEIGKALGLSKNAVVGKVHRLELEGRQSPIKKVIAKPVVKPKEKTPAKGKKAPFKKTVNQIPVRKTFAKSAQKSASKPADKQPALKRQTVPTAGSSLMDLKLTSCRWPIGDPKDADFHFCGNPVQPGKPYCPEHCKMAYISLRELTLQNARNKKEAAREEEEE